jgi:hypothetical protein
MLSVQSGQDMLPQKGIKKGAEQKMDGSGSQPGMGKTS